MSAGRKGDATGGVGLDVTIMGREYRVACKPEEKAELLEAVAYVDRQMIEIRDSSRNNNAERIAVMTALNIANELLRNRSNPAQQSLPGDVGDVDLGGLKRKIQSIQSTIDATLGSTVGSTLGSTLGEQEKLL